MTPRYTFPTSSARRRILYLRHLLVLAGSLLAATAGAQGDSVAISHDDPRIGLRGGYQDAAEVARNLELVGHGARPQNFGNAQNLGDFAFLNGDLAFKGNLAFQGGFNGFQVWDISNPKSPTLRTSFVCPGGQGDPSIYKNLLFFSVEETRGRLDCGTQGVTDTVSAERFRGVRIFDISDLDHPKQVAAVQTCRGSHTHTPVVAGAGRLLRCGSENGSGHRALQHRCDPGAARVTRESAHRESATDFLGSENGRRLWLVAGRRSWTRHAADLIDRQMSRRHGVS